MESDNEWKQIDIKIVRVIIFMIIKIEDFDFDNVLIDEKSYENILIFNISYKTLIHAKPFRIRFDKVDRFIRVYNGTRYLVLFCPEKYNAIFNKIRYLTVFPLI